MKHDRTLLLTAALVLGMTACGKTEQTPLPTSVVQQDSTPQDNSAPQDVDPSASAGNDADAPEVHIRLAEWGNIEWETFNGVYMHFKIPKGWEVTETGSPPDLGYHVVRPAEDGGISNTGWVTTTNYMFYHTQEWADKVNEGKETPVAFATMEAPTTKAFFEAFWALPGMDVTRFDVVEETYNGDSISVSDYSFWGSYIKICSF